MCRTFGIQWPLIWENNSKNWTPQIDIFDPIADMGDEWKTLAITELNVKRQFDIIVLAVPHDIFLIKSWEFLQSLFSENGNVLVMDIKAKLERDDKPERVFLWRP